MASRVSPSEFRAALESALEAADADERIGPLLRATNLALRFEFSDSGLVLDIAASEDPDRYLRWSFGGQPGWEPKLVLEMDSEVANRYLQGRESLAIAIARGQVRCRGDARSALLFLPATRLICEPYRRAIATYPSLVTA